MKIALIGCGAMGKLVTQLAADSGLRIGVMMTSQNCSGDANELSKALLGHDVAIDFSTSNAVARNVAACALAGVPLVEGTTGWHSQIDDVITLVNDRGGSLVYGANFSVGVQIFYRMCQLAAELFRDLNSYDAFIEEAHHKRKRDAPSGTALHLKSVVQSSLGRELPVASTRAGYIPGTHRLGFDSQADQILISHEARSREGFAAGALMAAHWIIGKRGVFEFSEVFDRILQERKLAS